MNGQSTSAGRWKSGAAGAALTMFLGLLVLRALANLSFDLLFALRPNLPVEGVKIIYMNEASSKALGQPWGNAAWDRSKHAELLNRLTDCRAKAVIFDVHFDR